MLPDFLFHVIPHAQLRIRNGRPMFRLNACNAGGTSFVLPSLITDKVSEAGSFIAITQPVPALIFLAVRVEGTC